VRKYRFLSDVSGDKHLDNLTGVLLFHTGLTG
jgi:hypothetical protein